MPLRKCLYYFALLLAIGLIETDANAQGAVCLLPIETNDRACDPDIQKLAVPPITDRTEADALKPFVGRLIIQEVVGGAPRYCSGMIIWKNRAGNKSIVATAAHCIKGLKQDGSTPVDFRIVELRDEKGSVLLTDPKPCISLPNDWSVSGDPYIRVRKDYAFILFNAAIAATLDVVIPRDFRNFRDQRLILGYPAESDGLQPISEEASPDVLHPKLASFRRPSDAEPIFLAGTSGGPWLLKVPNSDRYRLMSVSSSYESMGTTAMPFSRRTYGPDFTDGAARELFESTVKGECTVQE